MHIPRVALFSVPLPVATALALTAAAAAQDWALRSLPANPAGATFPRMAFDSQRGVCVEFGGWNAPSGTIVFQDTWEYDGTTWTLRTPATVPDERDSHMMAYDSTRGRTVMFGGWDFNFVRLGQTWEWDGTNWLDRMPANAPSGRTLAAMAYDAGRGVTVLFGGEDGVNLLADTWEWDGTNWTLRTLAAAPSARTSHTMAYDVARGRVVLFGGDAGTGPVGDTWEYDGANWFQIVTDGAPPARVDAQLVYDSLRARCVLVGGADVLVERDDTWEYDGITWRELFTTTRPQPVGAQAIAYDSARGQVVMFGGFDGAGAPDDTWELGGGDATYRTFGTGCIGGNNLSPRLVPVAMPALGTTTRVDVVDLPPAGGTIFLAVALSDTFWGPVALPIDLGIIGLTGCRGYTSSDAGILLTHPAGSLSWTLAVPSTPTLSGAVLFLQALSFDAGAPRPFPAALSNAAEMNVR